MQPREPVEVDHILHIGPARTGTTVIQRALAASAGALADASICYPRTNPASDEGQPTLVWEIMEAVGQPIARVSQARLSWAEVETQAAEQDARVRLLSSEDFCVLGEAGLRELGRRLAGGRVRLVVAFRDPMVLIPSIWAHSVRWGYGGLEHLSLDEAVPVLARARHVRLVPLVEQMLTHLGPETEVRPYIVPRIAGRSAMLRRFAAAARLPDPLADVLSAVPMPDDNRSLAPSQTLMLLELNRILRAIDPAPYPATASVPRIRARQFLLRQLRPATGLQSWPLSDDARTQLEGVRDAHVAWLRTTEHVGDIEDLAGGAPDAPVAVADPGLDEFLVRALLAAAADGLGWAEARDWWKRRADELEGTLARHPDTP